MSLLTQGPLPVTAPTAWKKAYQDLADGFGASVTAKADWGSVEKDMLATIDIEKLAVERATVEKPS